jgi:COMPASS component SWD1
MKQEEEEVDVDGIFEGVPERKLQNVGGNGEDDEDNSWADEEPDNDIRDWNLKIIMEGSSMLTLHYISAIEIHPED